MVSYNLQAAGRTGISLIQKHAAVVDVEGLLLVAGSEVVLGVRDCARSRRSRERMSRSNFIGGPAGICVQPGEADHFNMCRGPGAAHTRLI